MQQWLVIYPQAKQNMERVMVSVAADTVSAIENGCASRSVGHSVSGMNENNCIINHSER